MTESLAMRLGYWRVQRFISGLWLDTDYRVSGTTRQEAAENANRIKPANWRDVRLGAEVPATEHYCDFAWVTAI